MKPTRTFHVDGHGHLYEPPVKPPRKKEWKRPIELNTIMHDNRQWTSAEISHFCRIDAEDAEFVDVIPEERRLK